MKSIEKFSLLIFVFLVQLAVTPGYAIAQFRDWNTRAGSWADATNWNPNLVPGFGEIARIGNLPAAFDADVELNVNAGVSGLQIYQGMRLLTDGHNLQTTFDTLITGSGSRGSSLTVQNSIFGTRDLINETRLRLTSGQVNVSRLLENASGSILFGGGTFNLTRNSGTAMANDGTIFTNGLPLLTFNQLGDGLIDLDGFSGNGTILIDGIFGQETVTFNGTQLADSYTGRIDLSSGNVLNMNIADGWTADEQSEINLTGNNNAPVPSQIQGGDFTFLGNMTVSTDVFFGEGAHRIEADTVIGTNAHVYIESENVLDFSGAVAVEGGEFVLVEDASLTFDGPTMIFGGDFETHSGNPADGSIKFDGPTTWNGTATINGVVQQNGDAHVAGATIINATQFDLDGLASTIWDIGHSLTVNADQLSSADGNPFLGTINVGNGIFAQLAINLGEEANYWTMDGVMHLANNLPFQSTRVSGSRMGITGDLNANGSDIRITANTDFADGSITDFQTTASSLVMRGETSVEANALFTGDGTLINGDGGRLMLDDGSSLNQVSLTNRGLLEIGAPTGVAGFENTDDARWQVEIGGHIAGGEFDVLLVSSGGTMLDGILSVKLVDAGNGLFEPNINDEFTILSSVNPIVGQFDNAPFSISDGNGYQWEVLYNTNDVTLRLASIENGFILGDVNQDGSVDLLDVASFVEALSNGTYDARADINCDAVVDLLDVSLFVALLTGESV